MAKSKFLIAGTLSVILALTFTQSSGFAKDNPKVKPSPQSSNAASPKKSDPVAPASTSSSTSTPSASSTSSTPQVDSSAANTPSAPGQSNKPDTAKNSPSSSSNSGSNSGSNNSSNNSSSSASNNASSSSSSDKTTGATAQEKSAKKSSNSKLDATATSSLKANSKADVSAKAKSVTTASCSSKAKAPGDACSEFIVVFAPGFGRLNSNKLLKDAGSQVLREYSSIFNGALVKGPLAKMQALANNPNVLVVEDDLSVKAIAVESPAPWGLDRIDQLALPLSNTFDDGDLSGLNTYSYVVDTGIDATNVDFGGRVAPGFSAVADGLGSADCNGHGTHVAGTIGGNQYGVAKKTTLVPVRVLDCAGSGSYSSVISGLDWIAANYKTGDAAVVNMSLGGPVSSTLDGAVRTLISLGINVVVAAGNSAADACSYSPSGVTDAITVGATSINDYRSYFSNFGTCLDVFAPGSSITSTWLGATGTNTISGTSMSSPHVAGVVARFIGINPGLSPLQVANSIKTSAKSVVISAGTGSTDKLVYLNVVPDLTTPVVADPTPRFKKVTPRGKSGK